MTPVSRAALVTATILLDLVSKAWARAHLVPLHAADGGPLRWGLTQNRGASFGLGADHPTAVVGASAAAAAGLAIWLVHAAAPLVRVGVALALGGGLGNLVDRVAHGAVVDWIHVAGYPATFNLADLAIRAGLLTVLVGLLRSRGRTAPAGVGGPRRSEDTDVAGTPAGA